MPSQPADSIDHWILLVMLFLTNPRIPYPLLFIKVSRLVQNICRFGFIYSSFYHSFLISLSTIYVPKSIGTLWLVLAIRILGMARQLHWNRPADLLTFNWKGNCLLSWVYTKYLSTGEMDRLKARLVAKGYTHGFGIDYLRFWCRTILDFKPFPWNWDEIRVLL